MLVDNGAYRLTHRDREVVLSQTGWLTDEIVCAAQMLLLPNTEGLQPPTLQKVFAFQVHSGEFVQIIHVRKSHWCVVSTVGCESGVVHVYDSFFRSVTKETVSLIASIAIKRTVSLVTDLKKLSYTWTTPLSQPTVDTTHQWLFLTCMICTNSPEWT